jgi:hypothetical protein
MAQVLTRGEACCNFSRQLLLEEIASIVADAAATGAVLRAGDHAEHLRRAYPAAEYSLGHIMDELIMAAAKSGVPVEMSRLD